MKCAFVRCTLSQVMWDGSERPVSSFCRNDRLHAYAGWHVVVAVVTGLCDLCSATQFAMWVHPPVLHTTQSLSKACRVTLSCVANALSQ